MFNKLGIIIGFVLVFLGGIWVARNYYTSSQPKIEEQSQVLLERIQKVCKVITVEGYFSEVYSYQDHWAYDISPFQKKALVRVKAKVSVGYDLTKMAISSDAATKKIILGEIPAPSILSTDHNLDYYDITQGTFNSFTSEDYNRINASAKEFVNKQAQASPLFEAAKKEGNQMIEVIRFVVESAGWQLEIKQGANNTSIQK